MLHISIKAEPVFELFGFTITNSLLTAFIVLILFALLAIIFSLKANNKNSRFVSFIRFCIGQLYELFLPIFGDKATIFFPIVGAFFFFILLANWIGLIPGVGSLLLLSHGEKVPVFRAATADLNTTLALALIAFFLIQYFGIKYLGLGGYLGKFINFTSPLALFTGILEIVSEISKIISFAFRLFGNIFAGEVLLAVIAFLIPVLASFPFLLLEIFVGIIQALVFSMLVSVFFSMAIAKEH